MSEQFYNPYQFVPVDTRKTETLAWKHANHKEEVLCRKNNRFVRHDYWHKDSLSGRIRCTLTTLSPVIIGAEQTEGDKNNNQPGQISVYRDQLENPAIPANSLRGMVGSVAEVISQSALRVLTKAEQGGYSVRKPAEAALTEQGYIEIENGHYYLRPLKESDRRLPVKKEAVEVLEEIIKSLHERDKDKPLRKVQQGDKIRYASSGTGNNEWVTELSYSSIWRKAVDGSLHKAFAKVGDDSLPWNSDRDAISPVEALFGVVEDQPDEQKRGGARNLASRIRFTDARSESPVRLLENTLLKALSSPKPPSPSLYFHNKNRSYIPKAKLNLGNHTPNGRKVYLPHPRSLKTTNSEPQYDWCSHKNEDLHMQLCAEAIPANRQFQFEMHFENISDAELGLLLTALQPAGKQNPERPDFIHRLGLGKPIGLGHISIGIEAIDLIERNNRYSVKTLMNERYQPWAGTVNIGLIDKAAWKTLITLANPENIQYPVCYPFSSKTIYDRKTGEIKEYPQKAYNEEDGYRWFVENDRMGKNVKHQTLGEASAGQVPPTLDSE